MSRKARGKLIVFEGMDGCGKGTQAMKLQEYLHSKSLRFAGNTLSVLMHEPGGTPYGETSRSILKEPEKTMTAIFEKLKGHSDYPLFQRFLNLIEAGEFDFNRTPACELFLFEASRAEYAPLLNKILKSGIHVISDRLHYSTLAYQGGGRGFPIKYINLMNEIALGGLTADLVILLDIPVEVMRDRMSREGDDKLAHFERKYKDDPMFFERVRKTYLKIARKERKRFVVIDGDQPVSIISDQIQARVDELLGIE
jgi:dTMP kinase